MTCTTRVLSVYAHIMCRLIWVTSWLLRPWAKPEKDDGFRHPVKYRDWEWEDWHVCDIEGRRTKHRFIEWMPERVVTATCLSCGLEGTL